MVQAVLEGPDPLAFQPLADQGALGAQKAQVVLLVPPHHQGQARLLVLVIRVLPVSPAILAFQVFLILGNLADQGGLVFQAALAFRGQASQGVLWVLEGPELLEAPLEAPLPQDREEGGLFDLWGMFLLKMRRGIWL